MRSWSRAGMALGAVCCVVVVLSPRLLSTADSQVVTASLPPLGFYAAGSIALLLRAGHAVGDRLLAVGTLHLMAIVGGIVVARWPDEPWVSAPVGWLAAVLFAVGFVALLDLLARFPTGSYAWNWVAALITGAAALAVVLATLSFLGSRITPSMLGFDTGLNPAYVPALQPVSTAVLVVPMVSIAGVGLLLARYPGAPALDRAQLRWPILTAVVLAVALVTSGLTESVLGPEVQAATFTIAAASVPASFLIGLLRHSEEADRLRALEASRTRLVEVADAERRRIERDLHDGAQQQLLALLARVELARTTLGDENAVAEHELRDISDGIRQVHRDLRVLARGIHPAVLSDRGLAAAVRSALSRLPLHTELDVAPEVEGRRYGPTTEAAAYFLVLEGVANAMKHAASPTTRVRLAEQGNVLEVAISDSGRGFPATHGNGAGSGLIGLRDRLAAVGGRLEIDSSPGMGTTLRGLLPIDRHAAS